MKRKINIGLCALFIVISLGHKEAKAQDVRQHYPCTCESIEKCWVETCRGFQGAEVCRKPPQSVKEFYISYCINNCLVQCSHRDYPGIIHTCEFLKGLTVPKQTGCGR